MKMLKRILSALLAVMMIIGTPIAELPGDIAKGLTVIAQAEETPSEGLEYIPSYDGTYYIVSGIGTFTGTDLIIPSEYNGLPVKEIDEYAFMSNAVITSVTVPESVSVIGDGAFSSCVSMESIELPYGLTTVGELAFQYCSNLDSVILPDSVTSVGTYAFMHCTNLSTVTLSRGMTTINEGVFGGCSRLFTVDIPYGVTSIGDGAFKHCGLSVVRIPETVTIIGSSAFFQCSELANIDYEGSPSEWEAITKLSSWDDMTGPYTLSCMEEDPVDPISYTLSADGTYYIVSGSTPSEYSYDFITVPAEHNGLPVKEIGEYAFYNNTALAGIVLPDTIEVIGAHAFDGCSNFNANNIPSSVKVIGEYAFNQCYNVTNFDLPEGLETIGAWAFAWCSGITNINIPSTVTSVGEHAFDSCGNLLSIDIPASLGTIPVGMMCGCSGLNYVTIADGITEIGERAFMYCGSLSYITIPDSVSVIKASAFSYCESLNEITIPDSVTSIEAAAFSNCTNLKTVDLPDYITVINDGTFRESGLETIVIPEGVEAIGERAFESCVNLKSVILPSTLKTISPFAFNLCGIEQIELPDGITEIEGSAFVDCRNLKSVIIPDGITVIGFDTFKGCTSLETVYIPDSVVSILGAAFADCTSLDKVIIPDSVTYLGSEVFSNCTSLRTIILGSNIDAIRNNAFYNCTNLEAISLPESITAIESYAFWNCFNLSEINFEGYMSQWDAISKSNDWDLEVGSAVGGYTVIVLEDPEEPDPAPEEPENPSDEEVLASQTSTGMLSILDGVDFTDEGLLLNIYYDIIDSACIGWNPGAVGDSEWTSIIGITCNESGVAKFALVDIAAAAAEAGLDISNGLVINWWGSDYAVFTKAELVRIANVSDEPVVDTTVEIDGKQYTEEVVHAFETLNGEPLADGVTIESWSWNSFANWDTDPSSATIVNMIKAEGYYIKVTGGQAELNLQGETVTTDYGNIAISSCANVGNAYYYSGEELYNTYIEAGGNDNMWALFLSHGNADPLTITAIEIVKLTADAVDEPVIPDPAPEPNPDLEYYKSVKDIPMSIQVYLQDTVNWGWYSSSYRVTTFGIPLYYYFDNFADKYLLDASNTNDFTSAPIFGIQFGVNHFLKLPEDAEVGDTGESGDFGYNYSDIIITADGYPTVVIPAGYVERHMVVEKTAWGTDGDLIPFNLVPYIMDQLGLDTEGVCSFINSVTSIEFTATFTNYNGLSPEEVDEYIKNNDQPDETVEFDGKTWYLETILDTPVTYADTGDAQIIDVPASVAVFTPGETYHFRIKGVSDDAGFRFWIGDFDCHSVTPYAYTEAAGEFDIIATLTVKAETDPAEEGLGYVAFKGVSWSQPIGELTVNSIQLLTPINDVSDNTVVINGVTYTEKDYVGLSVPEEGIVLPAGWQWTNLTSWDSVPNTSEVLRYAAIENAYLKITGYAGTIRIQGEGGSYIIDLPTADINGNGYYDLKPAMAGYVAMYNEWVATKNAEIEASNQAIIDENNALPEDERLPESELALEALKTEITSADQQVWNIVMTNGTDNEHIITKADIVLLTEVGGVIPPVNYSEGLEFTLSGDGTYYILTGIGTCTDSDIVIPAVYNGLPVKAIEGWGVIAYNYNVTSITIPDGVTHIGNSVFTGNGNLREIIIPDSVLHIGDRAFGNNYLLNEIYIPANVTHIGEAVFAGCSNLVVNDSIIDPANPHYYVESGCLIDRASKTIIAGSNNSIIPADGSVTRIGTDAFNGCNYLNGIVIPEGITYIGVQAFLGCNSIDSVVIPASVTYIGWNQFNNNSSIVVAEGNEVYYSVDNCIIERATETLILGCKNSVIPSDGSVKHIAPWSMANINGLTSFTIPEGVLTIGDSAFTTCGNLTAVTIPNSVTTIGAHAFGGCSNLATITFVGNKAEWLAIDKADGWDKLWGGWGDAGSNVGGYTVVFTEDLGYSVGLAYTDMGDYYYVSGMGTCTDTDVIIPAEYNGKPVTGFIGWGIFQNANIKSIVFPGTIKQISSFLFSFNPNLESLTLLEGVEAIEANAFNFCNSLKTVNLPDSLTTIGENAFAYCYDLETVNIPAGVTYIGNGAFTGCNLTSITVDPENTHYHVDSNCLIETAAKKVILGLDNSVIPADGSVEIIGANAFDSAYIPDLIIPDTVTTIEAGAFYYSRGFSELHIPASVTSIAYGAFQNCNSLTAVSVDEANPVYHSDGTNIIHTADKVLIVAVGDEIPADGSVTSIAPYAFMGVNVRNVAIPEAVTSIDSVAFYYCNLKTLYIPATTEYIGDGALEGCTNVTITIDENNEYYHVDGNCIIDTDAKMVVAVGADYAIPENDTVTGIASMSYSQDYVIPANITYIKEGLINSWGSTIYYKGTPDMWVNVDSGLSIYASTPVYYYSEAMPADTDYTYWHYVDGVPAVWEEVQAVEILNSDFEDGTLGGWLHFDGDERNSVVDGYLVTDRTDKNVDFGTGVYLGRIEKFKKVIVEADIYVPDEDLVSGGNVVTTVFITNGKLTNSYLSTKDISIPVNTWVHITTSMIMPETSDNVGLGFSFNGQGWADGVFNPTQICLDNVVVSLTDSDIVIPEPPAFSMEPISSEEIVIGSSMYTENVYYDFATLSDGTSITDGITCDPWNWQFVATYKTEPHVESIVDILRQDGAYLKVTSSVGANLLLQGANNITGDMFASDISASFVDGNNYYYDGQKLYEKFVIALGTEYTIWNLVLTFPEEATYTGVEAVTLDLIGNIIPDPNSNVIYSEDIQDMPSSSWTMHTLNISMSDFVEALSYPGAQLRITRSAAPVFDPESEKGIYDKFAFTNSWWSGSIPGADGEAMNTVVLGTADTTSTGTDDPQGVHLDCLWDDGKTAAYDANQLAELLLNYNFVISGVGAEFISNTSAENYEIVNLSIVIPLDIYDTFDDGTVGRWVTHAGTTGLSVADGMLLTSGRWNGAYKTARDIGALSSGVTYTVSLDIYAEPSDQDIDGAINYSIGLIDWSDSDELDSVALDAAEFERYDVTVATGKVKRVTFTFTPDVNIEKAALYINTANHDPWNTSPGFSIDNVRITDQPVAPSYMPGDITGDEIINIMDALRLAKYIAKWDIEAVEDALDVTADGKVDIMDTLRLAKYIAKWDVEIH